MADSTFSTRSRTDSILSTSEPPYLTPDDIIIAVMGITGCGKTSFINLFSDHQLRVGHELDSCTQDVEVVPCSFGDGLKIYLVDTPGFDDTERTDTEILLQISGWLSSAYTVKLKLSGIIYLHRIPDVRVGGSGVKNLRMFRGLCGEDNLGSVVLATTMWDSIAHDLSIGEVRESKLKEDPNLWGKMIDQGSMVLRHDRGETSGMEILRYLIGRREKITLAIQKELNDEKKPLNDTGAGAALVSEMERLREMYEKKIIDLETRLCKEWDESREMLKADFEQKLIRQRDDAARLQARADDIVANERKRIEELIQNQEKIRKEQERKVKEKEEDYSQKLAQQLEEERRKMKEKYIKAMHDRSCAVM
ncbi:P-loop containing nucleoside triphosphate hydrolase protein [Boeremia exigua]|uniref:P-loop containing nucleoside triphosphate hydrolase protein n=1 Tax=Boeremia exigua TaxID=749465 RepID=UPI001E8E287D|nr:P-loop containing nucleoside triphosphate hydrolase protein [Boeremia exigua]KAH6639505.1 P-loop containing nucleoside triphosphate hydrolase protein [Boeremia exigua]